MNLNEFNEKLNKNSLISLYHISRLDESKKKNKKNIVQTSKELKLVSVKAP